MAGQVRDEQRRPIAHLRFIEAAADVCLRADYKNVLVNAEMADLQAPPASTARSRVLQY
jgi:hypothetical protein